MAGFHVRRNCAPAAPRGTTGQLNAILQSMTACSPAIISPSISTAAGPSGTLRSQARAESKAIEFVVLRYRARGSTRPTHATCVLFWEKVCNRSGSKCQTDPCAPANPTLRLARCRGTASTTRLQFKLNGGYLSVTRKNAYAPTRRPQRPTPTTKLNSPLGYRPVISIANQAITTATNAAMPRKNSTT